VAEKFKTRTILLAGPVQIQTARGVLDSVPLGIEVVFREPSKKRGQEERYHAMIGEIAAQCTFMGKRWDREDWKRLLIDAFAKTMMELGAPLSHDGHVVPSLDGTGIVQLGIQSRNFRVKEASDFIEFLFSYGAQNGVVWPAWEYE
jgi:hypothetical protein